MKKISIDYPRIEAVDLGLSVKWGSMNIGARTTDSFGDFFAWGELDTKLSYSWSNYIWCKGSNHTLTKYCYNADYGVLDRRTWWMDKVDDVAHIKLGETWHIPNRENWLELRHDCIWTWTAINGIKGFLVKSKIPGFTDKSIFLPAAGYKEDTRHEEVGIRGSYWSSSLYLYGPITPDTALCAIFECDRGLSMLESERMSGCTIRPVLD